MRTRLLVLPLALALWACGGDSSPATPVVIPTPPPPERAAITVTFNPTPVVATPGTDLPWHATYTMTITETAGLSGNVNFWTETLQNPVTNLVSTTRTFGADRVIAGAGTNHINARGSITIPRSFDYSPGGTSGTGRAINVNVVVQFGDDRGNIINTQATVPIL